MSYEYFLDILQNKYADFTGRARRSEYWFFILFVVIGFIATASISAAIGGNSYILIIIFFLAMIIPYLAVVVRRLHDVGKSGWFFFIRFIPIVGGIWLFVLFCTDSSFGTNEYGPNPKGIGEDYSDDNAIKSIGTPIQ